MKKGFFVVYDAGNVYSECPSSGILKKIYSQVDAMNINGKLQCKLLIIPQPDTNKINLLFKYLFTNQYKEIARILKDSDYVYFRKFIPTNSGIIKLLDFLKRESECKILYEFPTYPYDEEHRTFIMKILLLIDKIFRNKLKKYVDMAVIIGNESSAFGIQGLSLRNGIKCSDIPIVTDNLKKDEINLIAVANFEFYHGYERLIEGLNRYYKTEQKLQVRLHLVGPINDEAKKYERLIEKYMLEKYVIMYGALYGEKLTELYNKMDMAVCTLACHRKHIYYTSELKSREYLARGLPVIATSIIDILPKESDFVLYFSHDETPINIETICKYVQEIYKRFTKNEITKKIRHIAEENCDIKITMNPVINYILGEK